MSIAAASCGIGALWSSVRLVITDDVVGSAYGCSSAAKSLGMYVCFVVIVFLCLYFIQIEPSGLALVPLIIGQLQDSHSGVCMCSYGVLVNHSNSVGTNAVYTIPPTVLIMYVFVVFGAFLLN